MLPELKEEIIRELSRISIELLESYTDAALLINAVSVANDRYKNIDGLIQLSTTANIPPEFRIEPELESKLAKDDLITKYSKDSIEFITKSYIVNSVSLVDFSFESIYGHIIQSNDPEKNEDDILRLIRSAWSSDNAINSILEATNIQDDNNNDCRLQQAFQNYKEHRIIRHALVHSKGKLEEKHIRQIDIMFDNSDEKRKLKSIKNSLIYRNKVISLDMNMLLGSRKFLYQLVRYFIYAINKYC